MKPAVENAEGRFIRNPDGWVIRADTSHGRFDSKAVDGLVVEIRVAIGDLFDWVPVRLATAPDGALLGRHSFSGAWEVEEGMLVRAAKKQNPSF